MGDDDKRAPWWREALLGRLRRTPVVWAATPLSLLWGCWDFDNRPDEQPARSARADEYETSMDALQLQRAQGWNAGEPEGELEFEGSSAVDVSGFDGWRQMLTSLAERLRPSQPRLQPWYVPTLFQSLQGAPSELLRDSMRPVHTPQMDQDFARGLALRALFEQAGWPGDTAVVVDAPGARALAVAAALANRFEPVFAFGNWPHPLGVVPAHETLAAALYYTPLFEWARGVRQMVAPPVWVLDANRLNLYRDADGTFDNRYFVKLPSAAELQALGIRHVMYVSSGERELDDLNAAFVELCAHDVDVKMVGLDEFERGDPARNPMATEEGEPGFDEQPEVSEGPSWLVSLWLGGAGWWYGGDPFWQAGFWEGYGWYHPRRCVVVGPPRGRRHGVVVGPPTVMRHTSRSASFTPVARPNRFSTFGAGGGRPAGFGQVPVRAARSNGAFIGVRVPSSSGVRSSSGASFGRSGSLGRVGGGGFSA